LELDDLGNVAIHAVHAALTGVPTIVLPALIVRVITINGPEANSG